MHLLSLLSYLIPLHRLKNVLNEKELVLKILGSIFRFMFARFFLNDFSFINKCFQTINVKLLILELYM